LQQKEKTAENDDTNEDIRMISRFENLELSKNKK